MTGYSSCSAIELLNFLLLAEEVLTSIVLMNFRQPKLADPPIAA